MQGTVTKSTGSWYQVLTDDGKVWMARTRGKLRLNDLDTSNPVAVGDRVEMQADANFADTASISKIEKKGGRHLEPKKYHMEACGSRWRGLSHPNSHNDHEQ